MFKESIATQEGGHPLTPQLGYKIHYQSLVSSNPPEAQCARVGKERPSPHNIRPFALEEGALSLARRGLLICSGIDSSSLAKTEVGQTCRRPSYCLLSRATHILLLLRSPRAAEMVRDGAGGGGWEMIQGRQRRPGRNSRTGWPRECGKAASSFGRLGGHE